MLRRVRLRLMLWSGGSTLVVLGALGALVYFVVANALVAQSVDTLQARIDLMIPKVQSAASPVSGSASSGESPTPQVTASPASSASPEPSAQASRGPEGMNVTLDATEPGLAFGGPASGTIAVVDEAISNDVQSASGGSGSGFELPDPPTVERDQALAGHRAVWEGDFDGVPVRFMLESVETSSGPVLIEAVGDRTPETTVLRTLLLGLLVGGLFVLAGSVGVGYAYASRALVPIRLSLERQRAFAADASHELRTPLAIVRGATEELRIETDPSSRERALADIAAGSDRLGRLVDDLLILARADSGVLELRRERCDLADVVTESVAACRRQADDRGIRLRIDVEPSPVDGDPDRLAQLVGILVDNAIKHGPTDSSVTATVRPGATLAVDDDGPGIRPEDLPRLFDRFWRAPDSPGEGTGLGLAIADWIARAHGGTISAANRPAGGARFTVGIPGAK